MQFGETLLVLGALVIFSLTTLFLNDAKLDNDLKIMETEFQITAMALSQTFVERAYSLSFDQVIADSSHTGNFPEDLTDPVNLGPDGAETYLSFNDIDDFHGYTTQLTTPRAVYDVTINVSYVDSLNIAGVDTGETFLKQMIVKTTSPFYSDTVQLQYLYGFR